MGEFSFVSFEDYGQLFYQAVPDQALKLTDHKLSAAHKNSNAN